MEEEKKEIRISLSTFLLITAIVIIVVMGLLVYILKNDKNKETKINNLNEDSQIITENDIQFIDDINNKTEVEIENDNSQYEKYSELYDKYSDNNKIKWCIKDMLDKDEDFAVGAYTKSADIYYKDELIIEDGILNFKKDNDYVRVGGIDGNVKYIIVPLRSPKLKYVWALTEDGTIYRNNSEGNISYFYNFGFDNDSNYNQTKSSFRINTDPVTFLKTYQNHKIVDMCYVEEKVNALSALYFLTEDGDLINCIGEKYIDLNDEFYKKLNDTKTIKKYDVTVKSMNYSSRAYLNVHVDKNNYCEERDFWYIGCDENIKDIFFDCNYETQEIDDIYFLTENDNLYTQPLKWTYPGCDCYLLSQIASNVLKIVEDDNNRTILVAKDGKKIDITAIMYIDGE